MKSAKKEILIVCSTSNAFRRQLQTGGLQLLKEITEKDNAKVRILVPADTEARLTIKEIRISYPRIVIKNNNTTIEYKNKWKAKKTS
ncbi:MAG TPA: hypothetical protein VKA91_04155 [Nitrososphaeraceae archaeon]|nr:hypothetical protein [Nitrososphaeraceae archaeon]